tara:strand:+ start:561 stop:1061 length:501 start_codon:yes stop_codon:yes gene_type:complete
MKLNDIVTTLETSIVLNKAGFSKKSIFSYFRNKEGHIYVAETDFDKDELIVFAYTSAELIDSLPAYLDINTSTYIARSSKYENITEEEIEKHHHAELLSLKIPYEMDESQYMVKYSVGNRVIAFSQNTKGEYKNLIAFGDTEAECRAKMILTLIEEDLLHQLSSLL